MRTKVTISFVRRLLLVLILLSFFAGSYISVVLVSISSSSPSPSLWKIHDGILGIAAGTVTSDDYYPSDPNIPTIAVGRFAIRGQGLYNQQMAFTAVMMRITDEHTKTTKKEVGNGVYTKTDQTSYPQVLLTSLVFRDYLGTNKLVPMEWLFDVKHWNTFVPRLPRLVSYNATQHYEFVPSSLTMKASRGADDDAFTHPQFLTNANGAFRDYTTYLQSLPTNTTATTSNEIDALHPVDRLILQGALRPAPAVQEFIDDVILGGTSTTTGNIDKNESFMAMHLRIEQDFLCHNWPFTMTEDRNLTEMLQRIEAAFDYHPPESVTRCFLAVNRPLMEDATRLPANPKPSAEACQAERQENLDALNHVVRHGLWNGRVKVVERPSLSMHSSGWWSSSSPLHKHMQQRPVAFASLMDSEICKRAHIFIGRLVSTFTINTIRRRSAMGEWYQSYNYDHGQLHRVQGIAYPQVVGGNGG